MVFGIHYADLNFISHLGLYINDFVGKMVGGQNLQAQCRECCLNRVNLSFFLEQSSEDIFEPKLDELISQLNEIGGVLKHWLSDHLAGKLSSLASPDDLFNFFNDLRGNGTYYLSKFVTCLAFYLRSFIIYVIIMNRHTWGF